ncbi:MAG: transcription termination factor NusA [Verrucomicrobiota bacterium]|nr:transcription termination factor NusA [Verrucomicrobiota bacterium]
MDKGINSAEFLALLDFYEKEKGISREALTEAINEAILAAAKKAVGASRDLRVETDPKSGEIRAFASLLVVDRVQNEQDEISRFDAMKYKEDAKAGDEIEIEVTPTGFGRIAAQYANQNLKQYIRHAEKALIFEEFKDRTGDIVRGTVRRFERSDVIIDLGRYEALLPNRERVPIEEYQPGEQLRCYVKAVEETGRGPEIILSRADPNFVIKLFTQEVTEIADGTVKIIAVAREPGWRTKLAVHSDDSRVDPVGACVGLRGQRVKNIVRELNNEKVDIIHWSPDISTFVVEALKPAEIKHLKLNETNKRIQVFVNEDQLSLAIGKRGQNARLAQKLVGWHIDIEPHQVEVVSFDDQVASAVAAMVALPGIDDALAQTLVQSGFHSVADLQQAEAADLAEIPDLAPHAETILAALEVGNPEAESTETESPAEEDTTPEPEATEETDPEAESNEEATVEKTDPEAESNKETEPAVETTDTDESADPETD